MMARSYPQKGLGVSPASLNPCIRAARVAQSAEVGGVLIGLKPGSNGKRTAGRNDPPRLAKGCLGLSRLACCEDEFRTGGHSGSSAPLRPGYSTFTHWVDRGSW